MADIRSKPSSEEYREGWDRAFAKPKPCACVHKEARPCYLSRQGGEFASQMDDDVCPCRCHEDVNEIVVQEQEENAFLRSEVGRVKGAMQTPLEAARNDLIREGLARNEAMRAIGEFLDSHPYDVKAAERIMALGDKEAMRKLGMDTGAVTVTLSEGQARQAKSLLALKQLFQDWKK